MEPEYSVKPSAISLAGWAPLIGCFGYGEVEHMAAGYIRRCVQEGDKWLPLSPDEYRVMCAQLLSGYHVLDDDHGPGDTQPYAPSALSAGKFHLLDRGFMVLGEDGKYRITEAFIERCTRRRPTG